MPPGGDARTRQPQLAKTFTRTPLTPKVAAKAPGQPPVVSPLGRRSQNAGSAAPQRDDATASAVAAPFLNNITPRSGTRQTRVESTNTTPSGTPNPEKTFDGWENGKANGLGVHSLSLESSRPSSGSDATNQDKDDSKFFYASDARTSQGSQPQRPASVPQKPPTFFYAQGSSADNAKRTTSPPTGGPSFAPVLASTPEPVATKFFYANGAPDYETKQQQGATSGAASAVSTSSRLPPSRPGTSHSSVSQGPPLAQRPMSPVKPATTPGVNSTLQGSPMPPMMLNRPPMSSPPSLAPLPNGGNVKRRVSIESPPKSAPARPKGHARTGSVPILDPLIVPKIARSPQASETISPPLSPGLSQPAMTMASILQAAEDLRTDDERDDDSQSQSEVPHSPTKSVHSSDAISELVANARRERKVQDLEITNASLEAINRTLERQLRKQTAELRRYRRLSRSGRFSAPSSRVTSAAMSEAPIDLSDLSEEDEDTEYQDSLHESDFSSDEVQSGDEPSSPSARMAARRKRDEMRLHLDLTKHQELLIDSQKINQSIKRCLDWTEVLIKEGQKALEYHVRVSDVELGGHVLAPPDEDDEPRHAAISAPRDSSPPTQDDQDQTSRDLAPATLEPPVVKEVQDRDSGVELPAEGA